ncbi:MAG: hypothetical protein QNJ47_03185 [Nostocaceae cyanobacterium]|nr:hypothetical protein [Nostocaceae cyanobacterium]
MNNSKKLTIRNKEEPKNFEQTDNCEFTFKFNFSSKPENINKIKQLCYQRAAAYHWWVINNYFLFFVSFFIGYCCTQLITATYFPRYAESDKMAIFLAMYIH